MDIIENKTKPDIAKVWPVMSQLRSTIDQSEFEQRVTEAQISGYRLYTAREDGRILGALGFRITNDLAWGRQLYIDDLVIDEEVRGSGIGKALLDFAKEEAAKAGCKQLRLCSSLNRTDAHRFYEREGVEKKGYAFGIFIEEN